MSTKRRYIIDNDGTNLFGRDPLTDGVLRWTVDQCPKSVTTYMVCPDWIGRFMYPCSVGELVYRETAPHLVAAIESGEDPFGTRDRTANRQPALSIVSRMSRDAICPLRGQPRIMLLARRKA